MGVRCTGSAHTSWLAPCPCSLSQDRDRRTIGHQRSTARSSHRLSRCVRQPCLRGLRATLSAHVVSSPLRAQRLRKYRVSAVRLAVSERQISRGRVIRPLRLSLPCPSVRSSTKVSARHESSVSPCDLNSPRLMAASGQTISRKTNHILLCRLPGGYTFLLIASSPGLYQTALTASCICSCTAPSHS